MTSPASAAPRPLPIAFLVGLCVLNHTALAGARCAVALQALALGLPAPGLGLLLAPFALASTLGALPLGRWVDRVGARVPALAGAAGCTAGLALAAAWPLPGVLAAVGFVMGLGYSATLVALQCELARDRADAERRVGFSGFAIGTAASGGLGPFLAGQCMAHGGARVGFAACALLSLASLVAAGLRAGRLATGGRVPEPAPGPPVAHRGWSWTRGRGGLRRLMLADLLMAFAWNASGFAMPLVGDRNGWAPDTIGNLLAVFGVAVAGVRLAPASWRSRGGDWPTLRRALAVSGAVLALLPLAHRVPLAFALQVVLGCGLGAALPSVLALVHAQTPPGASARVLGLRQSVLGFGAATLPTGLGALVAVAGLGAALGGLGAMLLLAGLHLEGRTRDLRR